MSNKFVNVPVENDTRILFQKEIKIGEFNVLHQKWIWDGIVAESIIYDTMDIIQMNDEELINEVKKSRESKTDIEYTITKVDQGFIFINFNFQY